MFPVEVIYTDAPEKDYYNAVIKTVVDIHKNEAADEIESACADVAEEIKHLGNNVGNALILPLYSTLPPQQQNRIFDDAPVKNIKGIAGRKIIFATNIAETSLTIDGIVYVVDPGLSK